MKHLTSLLILLLVPFISVADNWDKADIAHSLGGRLLDEIEGVWQFPDDGATLLITRCAAAEYEIKLLDSPQFNIMPGQTIGSAVKSAKKRTYDAHFATKALKNNGIKKSDAAITITDEGFLQFAPYSENYGISLHAGNSFRQLFPFIFRASIVKGKKPEGLIGARRIYPRDNKVYKPCF